VLLSSRVGTEFGNPVSEVAKGLQAHHPKQQSQIPVMTLANPFRKPEDSSMWKVRLLSVTLGWLSVFPAVGSAAPIADSGTYLLPINCSELLPDNSPFLGFFTAVASGTVVSDQRLSRRLFRVLALREKINDNPDLTRDQNPIDLLIRKTLCFFREQKDPLRTVPFDDPEFLKFMKSAVKDLEAKVDDAVFGLEFELQQRTEYEKRMEKNRKVIDAVQREAQKEAEVVYNRLSRNAKRKAQVQ